MALEPVAHQLFPTRFARLDQKPCKRISTLNRKISTIDDQPLIVDGRNDIPSVLPIYPNIRRRLAVDQRERIKNPIKGRAAPVDHLVPPIAGSRVATVINQGQSGDHSSLDLLTTLLSSLRD
jgi:hypothetical protein